MKVARSFSVARPIDQVWALLKDTEQVAACMPGAELTGETSPGTFTGRVTFRLGPFGASFEGEATVAFDDAAWTGHLGGKGVDKRGGSRSRMVMDFGVTEPAPGTTSVTAEADVTLSGAIAQFGRTALIEETANILMGEFARNLEARLKPVASEGGPATSEPAPPPPREIGGLRLLLSVFKAFIARLLRRPT